MKPLNSKWLLVASACLLWAACASPNAIGLSPNDPEIPFELGGALYPFGDAVEIESVQSDQGDYSVGAMLTVRGTYHLKSRGEARLLLSVTETSDPVIARDPEKAQWSSQVLAAGHGAFELKTQVRSSGHPHVTFYDTATGKPFAGVYFGTGDALQKRIPEHYTNGRVAQGK